MPHKKQNAVKKQNQRHRRNRSKQTMRLYRAINKQVTAEYWAQQQKSLEDYQAMQNRPPSLKNRIFSMLKNASRTLVTRLTSSAKTVEE